MEVFAELAHAKYQVERDATQLQDSMYMTIPFSACAALT